MSSLASACALPGGVRADGTRARPSATSPPAPCAGFEPRDGTLRPCDVWLPGGAAPPCPPAQQVPLPTLPGPRPPPPSEAGAGTGVAAGTGAGAPVPAASAVPSDWDPDEWVAAGVAWARAAAPALLQPALGRDQLCARHPGAEHTLSSWDLPTLLGRVTDEATLEGWSIAVWRAGAGAGAGMPLAVTRVQGTLAACPLEPGTVNVSTGRVVQRGGGDVGAGDRVWRRVAPGVLAPVCVPPSYPEVTRGADPADAAPTHTPRPVTAEQLQAVLRPDAALADRLARVEQGSPLWIWGRSLYVIGSSSVCKVLGHSYEPAAVRAKHDPANTGALPARYLLRQQDKLLKHMLWGGFTPANRFMKHGIDHEPCADECVDGLYALRDGDAGLPPSNHAVLHLGLVKNVDVCPYVAVSVDGISLHGRVVGEGSDGGDAAAPPAVAPPHAVALPPHVWGRAAQYAEAGLIEHKCPRRFYDVIPPAYYDQIQLSMALLRLPYADFTVWRPEGFVCQRYAYDAGYAEGTLLPAVAHFYEARFMPALLAKHAGKLPEGEIVYTPLLRPLTDAQLAAFVGGGSGGPAATAAAAAAVKRAREDTQSAAHEDAYEAPSRDVVLTVGGVTFCNGVFVPPTAAGGAGDGAPPSPKRAAGGVRSPRRRPTLPPPDADGLDAALLADAADGIVCVVGGGRGGVGHNNTAQEGAAPAALPARHPPAAPQTLSALDAALEAEAHRVQYL